MKPKENYCYVCMSALEQATDVCPACGNAISVENQPDELPRGTALAGGYTVGASLSRTALTVRYIGVETSSGDKVFLEEFLPISLAQRDGLELSPAGPGENTTRWRTLYSDINDRWRRLQKIESRAALRVLDVFAENGTVYRALAWRDFRTLAEYLGDTPMPWSKARPKFMPILTLVAKLHNAGIVHGGISPETIVVDRKGSFLLTGFALPEIRKEGSGFPPELYEGFSAPEQYSRTQFQGEWTDIYSLGAVLYRALTGVTPPSAQQRPQMPLKAPVELQPQVPENVSDAILWAMEPQKNKRFPSVSRFTAVLMEESGHNTAVFRPKGEGKKDKLLLISRLLGALLAVSLVLNGFAAARLLRSTPGESASETSEETSGTSGAAPLMAYDFVGLYAQTLQSRMEDYAGVRIALAYESSEDYPEGVVCRQSVRVGEELPASGRVTVYISTGSAYAVLPDMRGWPLSYARQYLEEHKIGYDVKYLQDETIAGEYNTVVAMSREPGEQIKVSASDFPESVTLTVKMRPGEVVSGN